MMRAACVEQGFFRGAACVMLFSLCACGGGRASLPPPHMPIVATPDEAWRATPPPLPEPGEITPADVLETKLENGITLLAAGVAGSPYVVVSLVVRHGGRLAQVRQRASAILHSLGPAAQAVAEPRLDVTSDGIAIQWLGEPERLPDLLENAQRFLSTTPTPAASAWAHDESNLRDERLAWSDKFAVAIELRRRIFGENDPIVRAAPRRDPSGRIAAEPGDDSAFSVADCALVVTGSIDPPAVRDLAERTLVGLEPAPAQLLQAAPTAKVARATSRHALLVREGHSAVVGFGFVAPKSSNATGIEARLIAEVLGGALASLLESDLRSELGISYWVDVGYEAAEQNALLFGYVTVDESNAIDALAAIERKLDGLRRWLAPRNVARAKRSILARLALTPHRADMLASALANAFASHSPPGFADSALVERVKQSDAYSVRSAAARLLNKGVFVIAASRDLAAALQWQPITYDIIE